MTDRETAVLVPVPAAERVVSSHRSRLDGAAALGVWPLVRGRAVTEGAVDVPEGVVSIVSGSGFEDGFDEAGGS